MQCQRGDGDIPVVEDWQHLLHDCPYYADIRSRYSTVIGEIPPEMQCKALSTLGLGSDPPELLEAELILRNTCSNEPPLATRQAYTELQHRCSWDSEGKMMVYVDGSCLDPNDQMLRRSGAGVYFANGHPANAYWRVTGQWHSSYRAELDAVRRALQQTWCECHIRQDNEAVVTGVNRLIMGTHNPQVEE